MLELKVWLRVMLLLCLAPLVARAQIDPVKRELLQLGYNAAIEGHSPFSGYAFLYWNEPQLIQTNLALRLTDDPTSDAPAENQDESSMLSMLE